MLSTLRPKNTVATMRAHLRPLPFADAIHSHSATPMRPATAPNPTARPTAVSTSELVIEVPASSDAFWTASRIVSRIRKVLSSPSTLRAAPAYISLTAIAIEAGFATGPPAAGASYPGIDCMPENCPEPGPSGGGGGGGGGVP